MLHTLSPWQQGSPSVLWFGCGLWGAAHAADSSARGSRVLCLASGWGQVVSSAAVTRVLGAWEPGPGLVNHREGCNYPPAPESGLAFN